MSWTVVKKNKKVKSISEVITGKFSMNSNSFAFVKDTNHNIIKEAFIAKSNTLNSINGDIVKVKIVDKNQKGYEGEVIEIIQRKHSILFAIVSHIFKGNYILHAPILGKSKSIYCTPYSNLCLVEIGDKVMVEIINWGNGYHDIHGKIIQNYGNINDSDLDFKTIMIENNCENYLNNDTYQYCKYLDAPDNTFKFNLIYTHKELLLWNILDNHLYISFIVDKFIDFNKYNNFTPYRNLSLINLKNKDNYNFIESFDKLFDYDVKYNSVIFKFEINGGLLKLVDKIIGKSIISYNDDNLNELVNYMMPMLCDQKIVIKKYRFDKFINDKELLLCGIIEILKNSILSNLRDTSELLYPIKKVNKYEIDNFNKHVSINNKNDTHNIQKVHNSFDILLQEHKKVKNDDIEESMDLSQDKLSYFKNDFIEYTNYDTKNLIENSYYLDKPINLYWTKIYQDDSLNRYLSFFNPYNNFFDSFVLNYIFKNTMNNFSLIEPTSQIDIPKYKNNYNKFVEKCNINEKQFFKIESDYYKNKLYKILHNILNNDSENIFMKIETKYDEDTDDESESISDINYITFNAKIVKIRPYAIFFDVPILGVYDSIHVSCLGGKLFTYSEDKLQSQDKQTVYSVNDKINVQLQKIDIIKRELQWHILE